MAPIIRILLRYATFPLLAFGLILPEEQADIIGDPEFVQWVSTALGIVAPFVAEGWYWIARRAGWST
jgi:hypothetical protein